MDVNLIKEIIKSSIENAQIKVSDTNGSGDHFNILVILITFNVIIITIYSIYMYYYVYK